MITISCVYGPNNDDPDFYENIVFKETSKCQEQSDYTIMGGDWNLVLNQSLDTYEYVSQNNGKAKEKVIGYMDNEGFVDIFREFHPTKKRFTWRKFGSIKRARLDFLLVSASLLPFVEDADILPGIASDHSIPYIDVDISNFKRGRGFFKFNNSLIKDGDYVKLVNETIRSVTAFYAEEIYKKDFLEQMTPEQQQKIVLSINPQLFLETLLLEIRGKTIGYCAWKKRNGQAAQHLAAHRLELLEISSDKQPDNLELQKQLQTARDEVNTYVQESADAAQVRARVKWHLEGEKPSKFFCNLEKQKAIQKYIPQLLVKNDLGQESLIRGQQEIDLEIHKF